MLSPFSVCIILQIVGVHMTEQQKNLSSQFLITLAGNIMPASCSLRVRIIRQFGGLYFGPDWWCVLAVALLSSAVCGAFVLRLCCVCVAFVLPGDG